MLATLATIGRVRLILSIGYSGCPNWCRAEPKRSSGVFPSGVPGKRLLLAGVEVNDPLLDPKTPQELENRYRSPQSRNTVRTPGGERVSSIISNYIYLYYLHTVLYAKPSTNLQMIKNTAGCDCGHGERSSLILISLCAYRYKFIDCFACEPFDSFHSPAEPSSAAAIPSLPGRA